MRQQHTADDRLEKLIDALLDAGAADVIREYRLLDFQVFRGEHQDLQELIGRKLKERGQVAGDTVIVLAAVLQRAGLDFEGILQFLQAHYPGSLHRAHFEFLEAELFQGRPPLPPGVLYDLTQYYYLDSAVFKKKSREISAVVESLLDSRLVLYLYLLSLREDLNNENIEMIRLVLSPILRSARFASRGASQPPGPSSRLFQQSDEQEEATGERPPNPTEPPSAESASALLDKYFSDQAIASRLRETEPEKTGKRALPKEPPSPEPPASKEPPAAPGGDYPPSPRTGGGSPRPAVKKPRRKTERKKEPPTPGAGEESPAEPERIEAATAGEEPVAAQQPAAVPEPGAAQQPPAGPQSGEAAAEGAADGGGGSCHPQAEPSSPSAEGAADGAGETEDGFAAGEEREKAESGRLRLPRWSLALAAVAVLAVVWILLPRILKPGEANVTATGSAEVSSGMPSAASPVPEDAAPADQPPQPPIYTVQKGDSIWKIFRWVTSREPSSWSWQSFRAEIQALNRIQDPDLIYPQTDLILPQR